MWDRYRVWVSLLLLLPSKAAESENVYQLSDVTGHYSFRRIVVYGLEQSFSSNPHAQCMSFFTKIMGYELVFQAIGDLVGFL
jgi:hypothetical protein